MRSLVYSTVFAGLLSAGSVVAAQAMPVGAPAGAAPLVEHVAQGCGPGFARGPRGFCRPMGRRFYGPPPGPRRGFYGPRPGWHRPPPPFR